MKTTTCNTAEEFISYFQSQPSFKTHNEYSANFYGLNGHIFRGQADADKFKLEPSAFREDNRLSEYTLQTVDRPDATVSPSERYSWLGGQLHAELRAAFIFLEEADRLGLPTPIDYTLVNEYYDSISKLKESAKSLLHEDVFPAEKFLNGIALVQHHGVPTRLMDWSESPFVAAYFAAFAASCLVDEVDRVESQRLAVYVLRSDFIKKEHEKDIRLVHVPRHANNFLRAQKALFVHMPLANSYWLRNGKWPTLDEVVSASIGGNHLMCVTVPATEADAILRILFDMGITTHSLMPTLGNAAQAAMYKMKLFRGVSN
jgi:hypothetical protein